MEEKFYITDPKEYEVYASLVREDEPICKMYDLAMREFMENDIKGKDMLLNGGVASDGFNKPIRYECTVGHGTTDEPGKRCFMYNMYQIVLYPGTWGVEIYKCLSKSRHCKCFEIGQNIAHLWHDARDGKGVDSFHKSTAIYEDLDVDEILTYLVNKNITTYPNVSHDNKYNLKFLTEMQKRMIKVLLYFDVIYYHKQDHIYKNSKYKIYEKPENIGYDVIQINKA